MREPDPKTLTDVDLEQVNGGLPAPSVPERDYMPLFGHVPPGCDPDEPSPDMACTDM